MGERREINGVIYEKGDDGVIRRVQDAAPQGGGVSVVPLPMNPQEQAAERRAQADQALQERRFAMEQANQNKAPSGFRWGPGGNLEPIPGGPADPATLQAATRPALTAKERADAIAGYTSASNLDRIVRQLDEQYKAGPGATRGFAGLRDYLPTESNSQFDSTANAARGIVGSALGFTGGQLNTATEAAQAVGPYLPQAGDRDQVILDKIERLRQLANDARIRSVAILGGVPDANGRVTPNAMTQNNVFAPALNAAAPGAKSDITPLPPEMQQEYAAYLSQNAGRLDPDAYAAFRLGLAQKYGMAEDPARADLYRKEAEGLNAYSKAGGHSFKGVPGVEKPLSSVDQMRNNAANSDLGAAAAGAANMGGFGIPQALLPDQFQALGDEHPLSMAAGQVAGSIAGTSMLGKLGAETLGKALPKLMADGGKAAFGRNLATDTLYSGIVGGVTGSDPAMSALQGGVGSVAGQGVGKALGATLGGINISEAARTLRGRGVPLTVGQALGGLPKSLEDGMTSIPGIGDLVNARRLEGFQAFNRSAFDEAGKPVGAKVQTVGEAGVEALQNQISGSYDNATAGVNVPLDAQFTADMAAARQAGQSLPADYVPRFDTAITNRVGPIATAGELTGDAYQQAMRGLKGYRASAGQAAPGFESDYKDALSLGMDALTGQMKRGGGQSVVDGLGKADTAWRNSKVLQRAVNSASGGTGTGELQVFTPAQLNAAAKQSVTKFGGNRPMGDLIDAGQQVLPSRLPDSGTAKRMAMLALPSALGGGAAVGGAYGATAGDGAGGGAVQGALAAALLAIGGTKAGQRLIVSAMTDRPDAVRKLGRAVSKRKGLFGAAAIPLSLEGGQ